MNRVVKLAFCGLIIVLPSLISKAQTSGTWTTTGNNNRSGIAAVAWATINTNGSSSLQVAIRPGRMAAFGTPVTISTSANGLSTNRPWIDNAGRVLMVWNETPLGFIGQTTKTSTALP